MNDDFRKRVALTLPDETLFLHTFTGGGSIKELEDGRLVNVLAGLKKQVSEDGGQTWSDPVACTDRSGNGSTWSHPEPTALATSRSPACLKRVPGTDDLLILWNQVSADEIQRGRARHRLSSAISQNGGATWKFRKNVGALDGDDTTHIEPPPIKYYRVANYSSRLPPDDRVMDYPSACFWRDRAIISSKFKERGPDMDIPPRGKGVRAMITLGLPLQWFYDLQK